MIRTATPADAPFVAPLMFQAMSEIVFKLIQQEDIQESIRFLKSSVSKKTTNIPMRILWSMKKINRFSVRLSIIMVPI